MQRLAGTVTAQNNSIYSPHYIGHNGISIMERFWSKVDKKSAHECWEWIGTRLKRYGTFRIPNGSKFGSRISAHRYSYFLHTGYMPKRQECVCHHCDNVWCVNPNHLFLGTHLDNMKDKAKKGRASRLVGERNPNSKLSRGMVEEIRKLHGLGTSEKDLLGMFEIGHSQLYRIINRESWSK